MSEHTPGPWTYTPLERDEHQQPGLVLARDGMDIVADCWQLNR